MSEDASNAADLQAALGRLAGAQEAWSDGARIIASPDASAEEILTALLQEIDDTLLTARLDVAGGPGTTLTLLAGGRRLRSLAEASADLEAPEGLLGGMLDAEATAAIENATALLQRFAQAAAGQTTTLRMAPAPRSGDSDGGLALSRLTEALGLIPDDPTLPALERVAARAKAVLLAHVLLRDGAVAQRDGPDDLCDRLRTLMETRGPETENTAASLTLWLPSDAASGPGIGYARDGNNPGDTAAFAFDPASIGTLVSAWNRIFPQN